MVHALAVLLKTVPAGHTLHCDAFVEPAGLVVPYLHEVHAALPGADAYVFAGQIGHVTAPTGIALVYSVARDSVCVWPELGATDATVPSTALDASRAATLQPEVDWYGS